jgi:hypothetical protein
MAEGIFCDFCADMTKAAAQKTTVNATDSNMFRFRIIMARKYIFFTTHKNLHFVQRKRHEVE